MRRIAKRRRCNGVRRTSPGDTAPCAAYADLSSDKERLGSDFAGVGFTR
jgi:hypothetical protein